MRSPASTLFLRLCSHLTHTPKIRKEEKAVPARPICRYDMTENENNRSTRRSSPTGRERQRAARHMVDTGSVKAGDHPSTFTSSFRERERQLGPCCTLSPLNTTTTFCHSLSIAPPLFPFSNSVSLSLTPTHSLPLSGVVCPAWRSPASPCRSLAAQQGQGFSLHLVLHTDRERGRGRQHWDLSACSLFMHRLILPSGRMCGN